jgi:DNA-binding HxlR family transcriptional regulator
MATTPRPGAPVRGSTTGRPIMALLDLLGRRWTLRILYELRDGPLGFRPLQQRCDGMSSSRLAVRLTELTEGRLVTTDAGGRYVRTPLGESLSRALAPLIDWAGDWAAALEQTGDSEAGPS